MAVQSDTFGIVQTLNPFFSPILKDGTEIACSSIQTRPWLPTSEQPVFLPFEPTLSKSPVENYLNQLPSTEMKKL
jgi:hypothetical protein